jgi:lysophospholipase L1-like esterase
MAWVPLEKCPLKKCCVDLKKVKAANGLPLTKIPRYCRASGPGSGEKSGSPVQQLRITLYGMKGSILAMALLLAGCAGPVQQPQPQIQGRPFSALFYGDSLTSFWDLSKSFPGSPYTNGGVFGATAVTLAADFDTSVSPGHPGTVMILAGTNDVLQGDNASHIFSVLTAMYGQSSSQGIRFVICTLPPMRSTEAVHNPVIVDLNSQLKAYATANRIPLADYYSALVDPADGELQPAFAADTVHLNDAAYAAITPIAQAALLPVQQ